MTKFLAAALIICALCSTPGLAQDVHDGPTALKPLTIPPKGQGFVPPPGKICDYEHNCYPKEGGAVAAEVPPSAQSLPAQPLADQTLPPIVVNKSRNPGPLDPLEDPIVSEWRSCMAQALKTYAEAHDLDGLRMATASCQARLGEPADLNFAEEERAQYPTMAPRDEPDDTILPDIQRVPPPSFSTSSRRVRDIGCGMWPVGSDADRDCQSGRVLR